MKKFIKSLSLFLLAPVLFGCGQETYNFVEQKTTLYFNDSITKTEYTVYFKNGQKDIPYIQLDTCNADLNNLQTTFFEDPLYKALLLRDSKTIILLRENSSYVCFDYENNAIISPSFIRFGSASYQTNEGDFLYHPGKFYDDNGNALKDPDTGVDLVNLFYRQAENNFGGYARQGSLINIDLNLYNIKTIVSNGHIYLPSSIFFQTVLNDTTIAYNGNELFLTERKLDDTIKDDNGKTLKDIYYSASLGTPSEELIKFNYYDLCFNLDLNYGLKSEHGINESFDSFFAHTGYKSKFLSGDVGKFENALREFFVNEINDGHSGAISLSPYCDKGFSPSKDYPTSSVSALLSIEKLLVQTAMSKHGIYDVANNCIAKPFEIVGDTAYITFSSFTYDSSFDYYDPTNQSKFSEKLTTDTIALFSYARSELLKTDSVKNIVLDLSLNGGGMIDAELFVMGTIVPALICAEFTSNGGRSNNSYNVDFNFDKKIDGEDTFLNSSGDYKFNYYCLTSAYSFSCANLLPAMLKLKRSAAIIGKTSGGGACAVHYTTCPLGSFLAFSSSIKLCTIKNGSYYSIDKGVEPDYKINSYDTFFDRNALNDFIINLRNTTSSK